MKGVRIELRGGPFDGQWINVHEDNRIGVSAPNRQTFKLERYTYLIETVNGTPVYAQLVPVPKMRP